MTAYLVKKLKAWQLTKDHKITLLLLSITLFGSGLASLFQSNFGSIDIEIITIVDEYGNSITGKLYRPKTATWNNPLPGVILCHGMNNDKDTEAPAALEIAKRGMVALSVDQQNHGDSDIGMDVIGGFLGNENTPENDTIGAQAMYQFLKNSEFVDDSKMGIIGHSMGGGTARDLARINPGHDAVVIQSGPPDNLTDISWMNNYLQIWSYYEELFIEPMESRQNYMDRGKNQIAYNLNLIGETPVGEYYDETYGDFSAGTGQRYALCKCIHPAVTWNRKSIQETVAWMMQALLGTDETTAQNKSQSQTYLWKEYLLLGSLISLALMIIPLVNICLKLPFFAELKTNQSVIIPNPDKQWWKPATINTLIGGLTFIILPGLGMLGLGLIAGFLPIFRLLTGNGMLLWLLGNALICSLLLKKWFKGLSADIDLKLEDLGGFRSKKERMDEDRRYIFKSFVLAGFTILWLYLIVVSIQALFKVELRFMWPVFKRFTPFRFFQFIIYLFPIYLFFKINGGYLMFGQL